MCLASRNNTIPSISPDVLDTPLLPFSQHIHLQ